MPSSPSDLEAPRNFPWLTAQPFAHRGLHGTGIVENSRAAFEAAIQAGFGIELDVQPCADSEAVVFHDSSLERLCGREGRLRELTLVQLAGFRLSGTDESPPSLEEALALVAGRAPLLVEIKAPRAGWHAFCHSIALSLNSYAGAVAVMSFHPAAIAWFARNAPGYARGLVMSDEGRRKILPLRGLALRSARADFLAYDVRSLPSSFAADARADGRPVLTWTVRTEAERQKAAVHADQIIHELPDLRR